MKLYTFYQSSASYRVRIALNLKGIRPEMEFVNLTKGANRTSEYAAVNPQMAVPTLIDQGHHLRQSLAMMEYLEEVYPNPPILPQEPFARAHVRALALQIAADISPLGNLSVRKYITGELNHSQDTVVRWIQHWVIAGFNSFEKILAESPYTGTYCHGEIPTIADCCLIPQIFNARRWKTDLSAFPHILRIAANCEKHPAFAAAHPSQQADAA